MGCIQSQQSRSLQIHEKNCRSKKTKNASENSAVSYRAQNNNYSKSVAQNANNANVATCSVILCPPTPPKNTNLHSQNAALRHNSAFSFTSTDGDLDDNVLLHIMRCFPFGVSPKSAPRAVPKTFSAPSGIAPVAKFDAEELFIDSIGSSSSTEEVVSLCKSVPFPATTTNTNNSSFSERDSVKDKESTKWFQQMMAKRKSSSKNDAVSCLPAQISGVSNFSGSCVGYLATMGENLNIVDVGKVPESSDGSTSCIHFLLIPDESLKNLAGPISIGWLRERLKGWCQLSGHEGTIMPASDKTLWKKRAANDNNESNAYARLMNDVLCTLVPRFIKEVEHKGEYFMELEDLTQRFTDPAIMDVKMGTRTFLESEVTNAVKRKDLYQKMICVDPNEPTAEEHAEQAVTKLRYMQFRERESSTATLGFRLEAIKLSGKGLIKDFKKIKTRDQIIDHLCQYIGPNNNAVRNAFLDRLRVLRQKVEASEFFSTHEVIGSSLLFLHDKKHAGVWMIDFAKTRPLCDDIVPDHRSPWQLGNHEDGYLFGLDNFIQILEESHLRDLPSITNCS